MITIEEARNKLEIRSDRSAWNKGVTLYALELLESLEENRNYNKADNHLYPTKLKTELLNGADNWDQYSYGGASLIYDSDIAARLCTPSELKKCRNGERNPNSRETWLDCQSRALYQAANRIIKMARMGM